MISSRREPHASKIAAAIVGIIGAAMLVSVLSAAQQPSCLHEDSESAAQRGRRQQALRLARQINTLENAAFHGTGGYRPLRQLDRLSNAP